MPKTLTQMTDTELDARLVRLYRQHAAATPTRRSDWHRLIVDVIEVQRDRREVWLQSLPVLV